LDSIRLYLYAFQVPLEGQLCYDPIDYKQKFKEEKNILEWLGVKVELIMAEGGGLLTYLLTYFLLTY